MSDAPTALPAAGQRWTRQRQSILDVLRAARTHLDADQVYQLARVRDPRLSLSTVYRTLAVLRQRGLVRELRLGEGHHHYECVPGAPDGADHSHLICRACGAVVEFTSPLIGRLTQELARRFGYAMGDAQLEIAALCRACGGTPPHAAD